MAPPWGAEAGRNSIATEPLAHERSVAAAAFTPDGTGVVTASYYGTVRVWDLAQDPGSLNDWQRRAHCAPFVLENGMLVENHSPCP